MDRRGKQDVTDDLVTDLDVLDAGSDRLDDTGGVTAEHQRILVRHHVGQGSGGYGVVERVEASGPDLDQDGALSDLRRR
jgi:hypothetical protein